MIQAKHYLIRGRVQGVGYRYFAARLAERYGILGYVRNLGNGDVEVCAEGEEKSLRDLKDNLRQGPVGARVTEIIEEDLPVTHTYPSFLIRG